MGPKSDHVPNHFVYPLNPDSDFVFPGGAPTDYSNFIGLVRYDKPSEWGLKSNFRQIQAVSYTHLTLPTNREV